MQVVGRNRAKNLESRPRNAASHLERARRGGCPSAAGDRRTRTLLFDRPQPGRRSWVITVSDDLQQPDDQPEFIRAGPIPNFWTDTKAGIPYYLAVQTPEYKIQSLNDLNNISLSSTSGTGAPVPNTLGNVAQFERKSIQSVINHSNVQPVYDVYASVQDRDLGGVCLGCRQDRRAGNAEAGAGQPYRGARPDREHELGLLAA